MRASYGFTGFQVIDHVFVHPASLALQEPLCVLKSDLSIESVCLVVAVSVGG
jgi:hypothetical protein